MSLPTTSVVTPAAGGPGREVRARIDAVLRVPVLTFFSLAIVWLFLGCLLNQVAFIKLYRPEFLSHWGWLSLWSFTPSLPGWMEGIMTYGRIRPAATTALIYGWAAQAGIGSLIWVLSRLCGTPNKIYPKFLLVLALFWNLSVAACLAVIFLGEGLPYEFFAVPPPVNWVLFAASALLAVWAWRKMVHRVPGPLFASAWYALAAMAWFPALFATGNVLLAIRPVSGAMQSIVAAWVAQGIHVLWLVPVALAVAYYLVPAASGLKLRYYRFAPLAFWFIAICSCWGGLQFLANGPFPAWVVTLSTVLSIISVFGYVIAAVNLLGPFRSRVETEKLHHSVVLDFVVCGVIGLLVFGGVTLAMGSRWITERAVLTTFHQGYSNLVIFGVSGGVFCGAIYYILPRLLNSPWPSSKLVHWHLWTFVYGAIVLSVAPLVAGLAQGAYLASVSSEISVRNNQVLNIMPYFFRIFALGGTLMLVSNAIFILHVARYLIGLSDVKTKVSEFLRPRSEREMGRGEATA